MRIVKNLNDNWSFIKNNSTNIENLSNIDILNSLSPKSVNIPHTYNAFDGQDGGNDYLKKEVLYYKEIIKPELPDNYKLYIEFGGVNSVANVYANGEHLCEHRGGYSKFRVELTDKFLENDKLLLSVLVDNSNKSDVYPQMADFTFYGGIYRDVKLIAVADTHFCLDYFAADGITAKSTIKHDTVFDNAIVELNAYITNPKEYDAVAFSISDGVNKFESYVPASENSKTTIFIPNVHLWNGTKDPFLYDVKAQLLRNNEVLDELNIKHGVREFYVEPSKGFFLNGTLTPLRGVSRHQDRLGVGNALSNDEHREDAKIIHDLGANTIRLAHYQHDEFFYDLCDEYGFVIWAEIPFISVMNKDKKAHENALLQMKELIYQNYNHSSICFWGISNEITIGGDKEGLLENLTELNKLTKSIDDSRLTTMAQLSMLPVDSKHNQVTDILSYNHYFGWYGKTMDENEIWLDNFHKNYPERALGISEYGCEGIVSWHNDEPKCRDYSEEYQALYHEHMAKIIDERPWLWATHIWNMFDFGCDSRNEGGVSGRNNKGLVSLDRKIYKDSYYIYKAYWSLQKFVHISGRRYAYRHNDTIKVKIYSNMEKVDLYLNGNKIDDAKLLPQYDNHIFEFDGVELNSGDNYLVATAKDIVNQACYTDTITLCKVDELHKGYIMPEEEDSKSDGAKNWFEDVDINSQAPELTFKDGYFSIKDSISSIIANEDAGDAMVSTLAAFSGMKLSKNLFGMMNDLTLEDMGGMFAQDPEESKKIFAWVNSRLQEIKK